MRTGKSEKHETMVASWMSYALTAEPLLQARRALLALILAREVIRRETISMVKLSTAALVQKFAMLPRKASRTRAAAEI
jgi:hypothetical protein